ncbi:MAG: bifunctional alpha/beta hydrolase/class I SAM-dependent methyltransferase [Campylobacteraceae bacterium]|jgi:alpha-beta hydrolase superfamily lysophospholipase|nr:bifunctional alpha/beta hydrolase/class I SAM-dependent methyltransferase [Campylobacteraceae bacterium]
MDSGSFKSFDGSDIHYKYWAGKRQEGDKKALILLHRGHEHSLRIAHLVGELELEEFEFFAWDMRGCGKSKSQNADDAEFADFAKDLQYFVEYIKNAYGIKEENIAVIAQSIGAVAAVLWAHDYAPNIRALVLGACAFNIRLFVPFALSGLNLLYNLRGNFKVKSYVKASFLTHDEEKINSYNEDMEITKDIPVKILLGARAASKRVVEDANAIYTPIQMFIAGKDFVVKKGAQKRFFNNLSGAQKELHEEPNFYHDIFGEKERRLVIEKIKRFILKCFESAPKFPSLLDADKIGCTRAEADRLSMSAGFFKNIYWSLNRSIVKYASTISDGVKLGFERGFDSGSSLDYIYKNQPSGVTEFGAFADFIYLRSIGWRGIRVRKIHLEELLKFCAEKLRNEGKSVDIVDIAAGGGRYVLDSVSQMRPLPNSVLLRDFSDINVKNGQELIKAKNLDEIVKFEHGDAFDKNSFASLAIKPTLAIVSGLYELFGDNDMIKNSLEGLASSMQSGSFLIYTGQPWHPQLEYIARVLPSHRDGKPWVMRRRTTREMDQLVQNAGFTKITMRIDIWGIFTVSAAVRN